MASREVRLHAGLNPSCAARRAHCTRPASPNTHVMSAAALHGSARPALAGNQPGRALVASALPDSRWHPVYPTRARSLCPQDAAPTLHGWCANVACRGNDHAAPESVGQCADGGCPVAGPHSTLTAGCTSNAERKSTGWRDLVPKPTATVGSKRLGATSDDSNMMSFTGISHAGATSCSVVLRVCPLTLIVPVMPVPARTALRAAAAHTSRDARTDLLRVPLLHQRAAGHSYTARRPQKVCSLPRYLPLLRLPSTGPCGFP